MRDVVVIGCGIIGATVAKALSARGDDVLVLDDGRPLSGTAPSGGHLRPSWFGGMSKSEYEPAMRLLDETWGLIKNTFTLRPLGVGVDVWRVDTDLIASYSRTAGRVTAIDMLHNYPRVVWDGGEERTRLLVVAAGAWCGELVRGLKLTAKQGVSFRVRGNTEPFIQPWAPYKQVVAHQQAADEVWVGDGSAILPANWTERRTRECVERCLGALGGVNPGLVSDTRLGLRPYASTAQGEPCLLRRLGPRAWVATGAGKMGTIAAGWVAGRILSANP